MGLFKIFIRNDQIETDARTSRSRGDRKPAKLGFERGVELAVSATVRDAPVADDAHLQPDPPPKPGVSVCFPPVSEAT